MRSKKEKTEEIIKEIIKGKNKNEMGITLIALVITVIVLLILAGVTISALSGDNGILNNASLAKVSTEFAKYKEELELYKTTKLIEDIDFNPDTLTAGQKSINYEGIGEEKEGNIKTVIKDLEDRYIEKFIIINGKLYLMQIQGTSDVEIKAAKNTGIEIMPYEITEEGELVSSNVNLGLKGENGTITIPEIVTSIGDGAFRDVEGLKTIIIPGTVKEIGNYAFSGNPTLENVIMEEGVERIGEFAFEDCTGLKEIHIADSVSSIGSTCFGGCTALESINFPTSLKEIPSRMLSNCESLTEIVVPEGIEEIGSMAFQYCDKLKKITIPSTVYSIGVPLLVGVKNLETIEISENNKNYKFEDFSLMSYDGKTLYYMLQNSSNIVNLPETIEIIKQGAFENVITNSVLYIGENIKTIESMELYKFNSINVSEKNENFSSVNGSLYNKDVTTLIKYSGNESVVKLPTTVKEIKRTAFSGNKNIQQLILPEAVEVLESFAFENSSIIEIYLPNSLKNITTSIFTGVNIIVSMSEDNPNYTVVDGMYILNKDKTELIAVTKNLTSYNIPDTVEIIGTNAFYYTNNCTEIILPKNIKIIKESAFDFSANIKKIEIPSSIESIASNAFSRCNSLTQIIIDKKEGDISGAPWGCPYGLRAVMWNT